MRQRRATTTTPASDAHVSSAHTVVADVPTETAAEARFMQPFRALEQRRGTLAANYSRLIIRNVNAPVVFAIHDGALTWHELKVLIDALKLGAINICYCTLPGHGARANEHHRLAAFTPEGALQKVTAMYQACHQQFSDVRCIGISTGALMLSLLCLQPNVSMPTSVTLINPYTDEFWTNGLLLTAQDFLALASAASCGGLDQLLRLTTGHSTDLQRQTLQFKKDPRLHGYNDVSFGFLNKERELVARLKVQLTQRPAPQVRRVHVVQHDDDIYIPASAVDIVRAVFSHPETQLTLRHVREPGTHTIVHTLATDSTSLDVLRRVLLHSGADVASATRAAAPSAASAHSLAPAAAAP